MTMTSGNMKCSLRLYSKAEGLARISGKNKDWVEFFPATNRVYLLFIVFGFRFPPSAQGGTSSSQGASGNDQNKFEDDGDDDRYS